jgi:hypothetical protein
MGQNKRIKIDSLIARFSSKALVAKQRRNIYVTCGLFINLRIHDAPYVNCPNPFNRQTSCWMSFSPGGRVQCHHDCRIRSSDRSDCDDEIRKVAEQRDRDHGVPPALIPNVIPEQINGINQVPSMRWSIIFKCKAMSPLRQSK